MGDVNFTDFTICEIEFHLKFTLIRIHFITRIQVNLRNKITETISKLPSVKH